MPSYGLSADKLAVLDAGLTAIGQEWPEWHAWKGEPGLYARRVKSSPPKLVGPVGVDPAGDPLLEVAKLAELVADAVVNGMLRRLGHHREGGRP